jgi:hypothetical protein
MSTDQPTPETLESLRAERDIALRELEVTKGAWRATFLTKDALAILASEEDVFKVVRNYLPTLTDEERVNFFYEVERGYCGACGRQLSEDDIQGCQCSNDE